MKLLFCPECHSVFNLSYHLKSCECGKVKGKYVNNVEAVVNGEGYSIAIGNGSLASALMYGSRQRTNRRPKDSEIICWARPHEGEANPHTRVVKDLKRED